MQFNTGDKVKIAKHIWYPHGGTGTVSVAPNFLNSLLETEKFEETTRHIQGVHDVITTVYVEFDNPIEDLEGEKYISGEVEIEYLTKIVDE